MINTGSVGQLILNWNLERNKLVFNPMLETKLLTEEANEFYTATSLDEQLREFADFCFVWRGTEYKFYACKFSNANDLIRNNEAFTAIEGWVKQNVECMKNVLRANGIKRTHLEKALGIVASANMRKGSEKNADGKVLKGEDYVDPIAQIRELLGITTDANNS